MSGHTCANCRRPISPTMALTTGKMCDKCKWAAGCAEFSDDAKTHPRVVVPPALRTRSSDQL
jgi:hypothetical protein